MKLTHPISVRDAAQLIQGQFAGDPDQLILGLNEIHMVSPGDLTFVDVAKYYKKALESAATIILINQEVEVPAGKSILISDDPFRDYNRLTEHFQPRLPLNTQGQPRLGKNVKIGANVVFGEGVQIGDNTEIGHNVVIGSQVSIGADTLIYPNVTIYNYSQLGNRVCIQSGTVIGGEAFYYKSRPTGKDKLLSKGRVVIEDRVEIGANCTIDRGVSGDTRIGEGTILDNLIQIGHDTVVGKNCLFASQVGVAGVVTIEDNVILWGQVGVNKDLTIGKGAILLGKAGVMSSLEGGKTYFGFVASEHRQALREFAATRRLPELIQRLDAQNRSEE
jgi:UDP-3-O-[3-hydroxymyristoyl] glucosamine N-acyltransferase